MPSFDFISDRRFRESLEADHAEMVICVREGAWKSAQVAAGSIVEALLVDYLAAYQNPNRTKKGNPLSFSLSDAITVCVEEGVLSSRAGELCSVVKSFRNLIHPGRVVRLDEPPPDSTTAQIALQLVELITKELAKELQKRVGLTAEQVLAKLLKDDGSVKLLKHLLKGFNERQRLRLLSDVLPVSYRTQPPSENLSFDDDDTGSRLRSAYRIVFDGASDETKRACMGALVSIIKEEDGETIDQRFRAFFRAVDLTYVDSVQRPLVIECVLSKMPHTHANLRTLQMMDGLHLYLGFNLLYRWLDPMVRTLVSQPAPRPWLSREIEKQLFGALNFADEKIVEVVRNRLTSWIEHYSQDHPEKAKILEDIRDDDIPF